MPMKILHDNILIEPFIEKDNLEKMLETHSFDTIISNKGRVKGIGEDLVDLKDFPLKINDVILFSPSAVTVVNKTKVICSYKSVIAIDDGVYE